MELIAGIEPATSPLPRECSTSEPYERSEKLYTIIDNKTLKWDTHCKLKG